MRFTCPRCGGHNYTLAPGPSRRCLGAVFLQSERFPCGFKWKVEDDHKVMDFDAPIIYDTGRLEIGNSVSCLYTTDRDGFWKCPVCKTSHTRYRNASKPAWLVEWESVMEKLRGMDA